MSFLTAAIWLPSLIFAVHARAWADRFGHRWILMITADLGRVGLPVAALLHVLARWQLYAVAFAALPGSCGCCLHHCQVSGCRPKIPLKRLA